MAKDIKETLKEGTEGILSEEVLNEIETAFNAAVSQKAALQVESALVQQDDDHAAKVQQLLEAIDDDHAKKLKRIVEAVTSNHTHKLKRVFEKFHGALNEDASQFKGTLVENVSNYLDLYLEKSFPADTLNEAVQNKRAENVLKEVQKVLAVDMALAKSSIKDAVRDGKVQIDEAQKELETVVSENVDLKGELQQAKADILLDKLSEDLPEVKKNYVKKVLGDKDEQFITENFDYTIQLFDKEAERREKKMKEEATENVKGKVDSVITEQKQVPQDAPVTEDSDPLFNTYMGELGKY